MTSSDPKAKRGRFRALVSFSRDEWIDAAFISILGVLALIGFRTTYGGFGYLVVGVVGIVLGIAVARAGAVLSWPFVLIAAAIVVVYFLLGPGLVLHAEAPFLVLPSPAVLGDLARVAVSGWKDLLTTLPPVASTGRLLALPLIIGLVDGAAGFTVARRFRAVAPALVVPVLTLAAVLLLGTTAPAAKLVQGAVFASVAVVWVALRGIRLRPQVESGSSRRSRVVIGAVLIVATLLVAATAGIVMPDRGDDRVVLRSYVTPPVDISDYPSPLVGFRKYTEPAEQLWDQVLFTVDGLPNGYFVRFATLDDYNQAVWTAAGTTVGATARSTGSVANVFQRVGDEIATTGSGDPTDLRFTIRPGYAAALDVNAWLPSAGTVRSVEFSSDNEIDHAESFVFNLVTNQGIVPERLRAGDSYVVRTYLGPADRAEAEELSAQDQPSGTPIVSKVVTDFAKSAALKWSGDAPTSMAKVLAVAARLRSSGAYSDGGKGQGYILPGHSLYRLSGNFLSAPQPVGNDEQYAAAFAILVNQLGVPARVVLGAVPDAQGRVRGSDVHTWVEVSLADGWHAIPRQEFMPDRSKTPEPPKPEKPPEGGATAVPPPNPAPPRSPLDQVAKDLSQPPGSSGGGVLATILALAVLIAQFSAPILIIALIAGVIVGLKARRRRRRRTEGRPVERVAAGWRELLDQVRDLGAAVPGRSTRREQAMALVAFPVADLADRADAVVFGPDDPTDEIASEFWGMVDATRTAVTGNISRWRRWRGAVSLRSLLPRRETRATG